MTTEAAVPHPPLAKGLSCPVCPAHDIPPECLVCENCGTDLSPIRRVLELGYVHYNRAVQHLETGDAGKAISELYGAIVTDPAMANARLLLGKLLWKAGNTDEAIEQWRVTNRSSRFCWPKGKMSRVVHPIGRAGLLWEFLALLLYSRLDG